MNRLIKKYVLWTYGIFYIFILLIGLTLFIFENQLAAEILIVLSAWTSTFVFLAMFRKIYPDKSRKDFIKSLFRKKLNLTTVLYVFILQLFVLIGTVLIIMYVWNVPVREQITASWTTLMMAFGYHLIMGPLGEELGWRGFVLNELQKSFNPLKSAIIVGVVWGFWHAPLWFISTEYTGMQLIQYIVCFLICIVSLSIVITLFYNWNHNLLIAISIHQFFNYFMAIQAGELLHVLTITALLYSVLAGILILVFRKRFLSRQIS